MKTYTAICRNSFNYRDTHWIGCVKADSKEEAMRIAIVKAAEDSGNWTAASTECYVLIAGDVKVLVHDDCDSSALSEEE